MTAFQKTIITATVALLSGVGLYQLHQTSQLRDQVQTLQQQQTPSAEQTQQVERERDEATNRLAQLAEENVRLKRDTAELLRLRNEVALLRRSQQEAQQSAPIPGPSPAETATNQEAPDDIGRKLGTAIVQGDPTAFEKLVKLAKDSHTRFTTNSIGLKNTQRGELGFRTFASLRAAFDVITKEAVTANPFALNAISEMTQIPEVQGLAIQSLGTLAANGSSTALEILLDPAKFGFPVSLTSSVVAALVPVARNGNPQAIDALAAVTRDGSKQALWYMAANGLRVPAEGGNPAALDALIALSGTTNRIVLNAVVAGLKGAASNQNMRAAETLQLMGIQKPQIQAR